MAHRRNGSARPNGEHDPFREWLAHAMDELLKFAERSDRRWEAQERRWEAQELRWEEERRLRQQQHEAILNGLERNTAALDTINKNFQESARITIGALKSVVESLQGVAREIRRLRGPNGKR